MTNSRDGKAADGGSKASMRSRAAIAALLVVVVALMLWNPPQLYFWLKAVHVIAVISWMAGLLYLPRLFIYHSESETGSVQSETFKVMESRLYRLIMTPAMAVTWIMGLWLAWQGFGFAGWWLWLKIAAVVALTGVQGIYGRAVKDFGNDARKNSVRYWRIMNEVPTLLMIFIVIMVVVKPF